MAGLDDLKPERAVVVRFVGNKGGVACYPSELSRTWPPARPPTAHLSGSPTASAEDPF